MAWTAPTTRSTGDLITASIWNVDLKDNLDYLKTEVDKLDDVSQSDVTGSRLINATVYQNTSGKTRIATLNVEFSVLDLAGTPGGSGQVIIVSDTSASPTTEVGLMLLSFLAISLTDIDYVKSVASSTFVVPNNSYYKATAATAGDGVAPVLHNWFEWDLH